MSARQIPADSWKSFFDAFTRQHHGWLVSIGDAPPEPLDEARADGRIVEIRAGSRHHRISPATMVTVTSAQSDETAIDHIEIAGEKERVTVRFRAVINPELVDGVMP
jgi:hypothetical protein